MKTGNMMVEINFRLPEETDKFDFEEAKRILKEKLGEFATRVTMLALVVQDDGR